MIAAVLRPLRLAVGLLVTLVIAPAAHAQGLAAPCPGQPIEADRAIQGDFGPELSKSFVMVPFDVPRGTTAIRVKYCFDRPESGSSRHTLVSASMSRGAAARPSGAPASSVAGEARATPT